MILRDFIEVYDFLLFPIYIIVFSMTAIFYKKKFLQMGRDEYKYFDLGIIIQMTGAFAFAMIYAFYYKDGDTGNYYRTGKALMELLFTNPSDYSEVMFGNPNPNRFYYFYSNDYTFPVFWTNDKYAFFVSKITSIVTIFGAGRFIPTTLTFSILGFWGNWKLFQLFCEIYPQMKKQLFIAIFAVPSTAFWTSGIMKDTVTLSAVCWYLYGFYNLLIKKRLNWYYWLAVILSVFVHLNVKPYVLYALLPGSLIWWSISVLDKYNVSFFRSVLTLILISFGSTIGFFALNLLSNKMGDYAVDRVLEKSEVVRNDLKREAYQGNSFDIGEYDNSLSGMISIAPKAIFAGLFRPTLLDVRNIVMLISAIENTVLLYLLIRLFWKYKWKNIFSIIYNQSIVLFMLVFSLFFSFSVGLSISNFGSLVRLKTPALPFFTLSLFIIEYYCHQEKIKKFYFISTPTASPSNISTT
ncbi:MAG: hypothetical protein D6799_05715 [Bacteroidetes bacterium]|nr:MAG: hypothetical protein D6799_05715 [Bacteroidota bacterium]